MSDEVVVPQNVGELKAPVAPSVTPEIPQDPPPASEASQRDEKDVLPPTPEPSSAEPREVIRQRELNRVANQLIYREGSRVQKEIDKKKDQRFSSGELSAYGYYKLTEIAKGNETFKPITDLGDIDGLHPEKGNALFVLLQPGKGWSVSSSENKSARPIHTIIGKENVDGQIMFVCGIVGQEEPQNIPVETVLQAQLLSDSNILTQHYSEGSDERDVLEASFALAKNGTPPPDSIDSQLERTGRKTNQIGTEAGRKFIEKNFPEQTNADGKPLTPEQQAQNERRKKLLTRLENKLFLAPDDLAAIFRESISPESISLKKMEIESEIASLEGQLSSLGEDANPNIKSNLENKLAELKSQHSQYELLQQNIADPEPLIKKFTDRISSGELPITLTMDIEALLGNGDPVALAEKMLSALDSDDPAVKAEIAKWQEFIKSIANSNAAKIAGGLILITLFMAFESIKAQGGH